MCKTVPTHLDARDLPAWCVYQSVSKRSRKAVKKETLPRKGHCSFLSYPRRKLLLPRIQEKTVSFPNREGYFSFPENRKRQFPFIPEKETSPSQKIGNAVSFHTREGNFFFPANRKRRLSFVSEKETSPSQKTGRNSFLSYPRRKLFLPRKQEEMVSFLTREGNFSFPENRKRQLSFVSEKETSSSQTTGRDSFLWYARRKLLLPRKQEEMVSFLTRKGNFSIGGDGVWLDNLNII